MTLFGDVYSVPYSIISFSIFLLSYELHGLGSGVSLLLIQPHELLRSRVPKVLQFTIPPPPKNVPLKS
ncbi:MAG: hypothetical protein EZS28_041167 [Streblomastix strix]|uniref:Uncharacterized protein n=1 Tax=Streblomastix strix TaxID=222440 RepID=A0A5J4U0T4_9EUKA|nr:MAG: hypothetical protein EZS28_041167 [Streblomastix strix]